MNTKQGNVRSTLESLRGAMQPLRSARAAGSKELPNDLHYSSIPQPYGATTGELEFGGELQLHFGAAEIRYVKNKKTFFAVRLDGESQVSLATKTFEKLSELGVDDQFDRSKIQSTAELIVDSDVAQKYASIQNKMTKALEQLKKDLDAKDAVVALWPHGFDLSLLILLSEDGSMGMSYGFSPGIDNGEPYLYAFAWPTPAGMQNVALPSGGEWETSWSSPGAMYKYKTISARDDEVTYATELLVDFNNLIAPMLKSAQ